MPFDRSDVSRKKHVTNQILEIHVFSVSNQDFSDSGDCDVSQDEEMKAKANKLMYPASDGMAPPNIMVRLHK